MLGLDISRPYIFMSKQVKNCIKYIKILLRRYIMNLEVIENGKIVKSVIYEKDRVIKPALGVDVSNDVLICVGGIDEVKEKVAALDRSLRLLEKNYISSLMVIPLYSRLSIDDCDYVINIATNYTASKFLVELADVFFTDRLEEWLDAQKKEKSYCKV